MRSIEMCRIERQQDPIPCRPIRTSQVAAGGFINTEPVVDGDRRMNTGRAIRNGIDGESLVLLDLRFQYMLQAGPCLIGLFWEMYNATNRVNYGNPTGNRRSSDFMVPTSAHNPRTMQLGLRYSF
jgi:hypothetical protein